MSMHYWSEEGYGLSGADFEKADNTKLFRFIMDNATENITSHYNEMMESSDYDTPDISIFYDYEDDRGYTGESLAFTEALNSYIIKKYGESKKMEFFHTGTNDYGSFAIILYYSFPWEVPTFTKEEVDEVLCEVMRKIGVEDFQPECQSIEMWG